MERVKHKEHRSHGGGDSHACSECGKTFSSPYKLKRHFIIHIGEKPYSCSICNLRFNQAAILKRHMKTHGKQSTKQTATATQAKGKACTRNSRSSSSSTKTAVKSRNPKVLKPSSIKIIPPRNKVGDKASKTPTYECAVCRMGFMQLTKLQRHMNIHASSIIQDPVSTYKEHKPHECPLCGMTFRLVYNLERHMSIHAAELEGETHDCPFCSKRFTSRSAFIRHQRSHFLLEDTALAAEKSKGCGTGYGADKEEAKSDKDAEHYTCCLCRQQFYSVLDICNHMQTHCSQESQPFRTEQDDRDEDDDDESMPSLEQSSPAVRVPGGRVPCLTVQINPDDDDDQINPDDDDDDDESMPELSEPKRPDVIGVDDSEEALPCLIGQDEHDVKEIKSEQKSMAYLTESDGPNAVMIDDNHNAMPCLTVQHGSDATSVMETGNKETTENRTLKKRETINTARDIHPTESMKLYCMSYIEDQKKCVRQYRDKAQRNIFEVASRMKDTMKKEQSERPAAELHSQEKSQANKIMSAPKNGAETDDSLAYVQVRTMRMAGRFRTSTGKLNWNPGEENDLVKDASSTETMQVNESLKQGTGVETHNLLKKDELCTVHPSSATSDMTQGKAELPHEKVPVYYKCGLCSNIFGSAAIRDQHMKLHLVTKLLKCMPCGNLFVDSAALLLHFKTNRKCSQQLKKAIKHQSHVTTHSGDEKDTHLLDGNPLPASPVSTLLQTPGTVPPPPPPPPESTLIGGETKFGLKICTENEVTELQTHGRVAVSPTGNNSAEEGSDSDVEPVDQSNALSQTPVWEPVCAAEDAACTKEEEKNHSGWEVCMDQESEEEDVEVMDAEWELHVDDEAEPNSALAKNEDPWNNSGSNTYADVNAEHMQHAFRICGDEVTVLPKAIKDETDAVTETNHRAEAAETGWPTIRSQLVTGGFGSLSESYTTGPVVQSCDKTEHHSDAGCYQCTECWEQFDSSSNLKQHDKQHRKKAYQCAVCEKRFYKADTLIVHARSHPPEEYARVRQQEKVRARVQKREKDEIKIKRRKSSHQLPETKNTIKPKKAEPRLDMNTGAKEHPHNCSICGKEITPSAKEVQLQSCKYVPLKCTECYDRFYKHRVDGNAKKRTSSEAASQRKKATPNLHTLFKHGEEQGAMQCVQCGAGFDDLTHFSAHMEKHRQEKAEENSEPKLRTPERYYCTECGEHFKYVSILKAHMKTHSKEETYRCPYCDVPFSSSSDLDRHILQHTGEKFYRCALCKMTFFKSTELNQHMLLYHSTEKGNRPYECSHCGRRFASAGVVTLHIKSHLQNAQFKCSHCEQRFDTKAERAEHNETHIEVRPVTCYACNATFTRWDYLKRHVLTIHRNYQEQVCPYCGDYCTDSQTINEHLRRHAAEKNHVCTVCGEKFLFLKLLTRHMKKKHTVKEVHRCVHCSSTFTKLSALKNHMHHMHKNLKSPAKSPRKVTTPENGSTDKNIKTPGNNVDKLVKTEETDTTEENVKPQETDSTNENEIIAQPGNSPAMTVKTPKINQQKAKPLYNDCSTIKMEKPDNVNKVKNPRRALTDNKVTTPLNDGKDIKVEPPGKSFHLKSQDKRNKAVSKDNISRNPSPKVRTPGRCRLQCAHCQKKFILRRNLNQHMRERKLMGGVCSTPVQHPQAPVAHRKPHTSYSQCGACVMGFSQSVYLQKHLAMHADVL